MNPREIEAIAAVSMPFGIPVELNEDGELVPHPVTIEIDWQRRLTVLSDDISRMVGVLRPIRTFPWTYSSDCEAGEAVKVMTDGALLTICGHQNLYLRLEGGQPVGIG